MKTVKTAEANIPFEPRALIIVVPDVIRGNVKREKLRLEEMRISTTRVKGGEWHNPALPQSALALITRARGSPAPLVTPKPQNHVRFGTPICFCVGLRPKVRNESMEG